MTISLDGKTISINAEWLAERIAKGEMDAKQLWNLMHHELLHLTEMRVRRIEVNPDEDHESREEDNAVQYTLEK